MTYAIIAYVLSLVLWLVYVASVTARLNRALGESGKK
jgi:hypothetical protein